WRSWKLLSKNQIDDKRIHNRGWYVSARLAQQGSGKCVTNAALIGPGKSAQNNMSGNATSGVDKVERRISPSDYSFAYSALAAMRMGISGSASFQSVRKS